MANGNLDPLTNLPIEDGKPKRLQIKDINFNELPDDPTPTRGVTVYPGLGKEVESFQEYLGPNISFEGRDLFEERAQAQPWLEKASYGVGRAIGKFATEVGKMPGFIGGAVDWASTGFETKEFGRLVDNAWINYFEDLDEDIKESMPVYMRKSVIDGNLWDNITSVDFWATDGADGIGFLASMFVPGQAIKTLGIGNKVARGIKMGTQASRNIDAGLAVTLNTTFEAGVEAGGVVDALKQEFARKQRMDELNPETGQPYTDEEIHQIIGEAGVGTFLTNFAILLGPNAIAHKALFGRFLPKKTAASKLISPKTGKVLDDIPVDKYATLKTGLKRAGLMTATEGPWEEGMQFASEEYFKKKALLETDEGVIEGILDSYAESLSNIEMQKAMFLGSFLGEIGRAHV